MPDRRDHSNDDRPRDERERRGRAPREGGRPDGGRREGGQRDGGRTERGRQGSRGEGGPGDRGHGEGARAWRPKGSGPERRGARPSGPRPPGPDEGRAERRGLGFGDDGSRDASGERHDRARRGGDEAGSREPHHEGRTFRESGFRPRDGRGGERSEHGGRGRPPYQQRREGDRPWFGERGRSEDGRRPDERAGPGRGPVGRAGEGEPRPRRNDLEPGGARRPYRPPRYERTDYPGRHERADRAPGHERAEGEERPEAPERADGHGRRERDERAERRARPEHGGYPRAESHDRFERGGRFGGDRERRPTDRPRPARAVYTAHRETPVDELLEEDEELVAGRHPVEEAFLAHREARRLLVVPQRRQALEKLVLHATHLRIPIVEIEGGTLTSLAGFDGHQGVALVTDRRRFGSLDEILDRARERHEPPLVLALDSLEDPQNLGTLLRSAESAGVHGVVFPTRRQAPLSAAAVKASAGAVEHLLLVPVDDLAEALTDLHVRGLRILGSEAEAPMTARQADLRGPLALVVGSEGQGLGPAVRRRCDALVRIPMRGRIASLNAAVAGSVLLYEASSQRGGESPDAERRATLPEPEPHPPTGDATAAPAERPAAEAEPPAAEAEPSSAEAEPPAAEAEPQANGGTEPPAAEAEPQPEAERPAEAQPGAEAQPPVAESEPTSAESADGAGEDLLPGGPASE